MSNQRRKGLRAGVAAPHGAKHELQKSVAGPGRHNIPGNNTQRQRGTCNLCCKVFPIDELNKPVGQLCGHWKPECRCGIYPTRPPTCRNYHCAWLLELVGDEFQPSECHMVLTHIVNTGQLMVAVDPDYPNIWMKSEYPRFFVYHSLKYAPVRIMIGDGGNYFELYPDKCVHFQRVEQVALDTFGYCIIREGRVRLSIVDGGGK